ncbi:hypothetical protein ACM9HF_18505 [Colwellia sp. RE-S-Sl-9]
MKEWESIMREAKQAFNDKVFSVAIFLNKQALDVANDRFNEYVNEDAEKSVAAVMVSYFSLADSYIQIRDFQQAYSIYQQSFSFLQVITSDLYKNRELEVAASHGMSHLKNEWYLFIKHHENKLQTLTPSLIHQFQKNLNQLMSATLTIH